jgi:hypothetical protein
MKLALFGDAQQATAWINSMHVCKQSTGSTMIIIELQLSGILPAEITNSRQLDDAAADPEKPAERDLNWRLEMILLPEALIKPFYALVSLNEKRY